jgi:YtkA-like
VTSSRAGRASAPPSAPDTPTTPPARTSRLSRRAALALAGGALGVLGIGWLADLLAVLPLSAAPSGPLTTQVGLYHVTLDLHPSPPRVGSSAQATIAILSPEGAALTGLAVDVAATMIEMDMLLPPQRAHEQPGQARYGCALLFTMAGTWRVNVRFAQSSAPQLATSFDVTVR